MIPVARGDARRESRRRAQATIDSHEPAQRERWTTADVRRVVEELGGVIGLLDKSDPNLRSRFYEEVRFTGTYDPVARCVGAELNLGCA